MVENGLSARESFIKAFEAIKQKLNGTEITLSSAPKAEIANDSDWHRTKIGYSAYEKVILVTINGKEWVIALGIARGDYPADPYNCDIAAIPVILEGKADGQVLEEIHKTLERNFYFRNSVVIAMGDGQLTLNGKGPFRQELLKTLEAGVPKEFTAQQLEHQEGVFHTDCRPVVKSAKRYTEDFPDYLSNKVCETLTACS